MTAEKSSKSTITMDMIRDCSPSRPKLTKVSERHPKLLMDQINQLRRSNEFCDVILHVGNTKISAHKIVLSASSPYFRAMFTGELAESKQTEITIKDVDENAMEMLIDFCYTSRITVDEKSVQTLLPAACLLQLYQVQDYCSEFLRSQLDPSNVLGIRAFADTHSCRDLLRLADKYMLSNFIQVVESDEFVLLPVNHLIEIISNDELNIKNEEQVYEAVLRWVTHDLDERKQYLSQLMFHVRLPLLDTKYLVTKVSNDPLIKQDQNCRDLIDEAKDYHLLPKERYETERTKPRKPMINSEVLFAVGGWCSGDAIASVEMYNDNEWKLVQPMNRRRCGVGVGVLNGHIYAICGHDGQSYLNSVERYDPIVNQWFTDVAPTSSCRTSVGVAVLDSYLYAVGGQDGLSCLNIVEKYDLLANKWTRVASLNTRRLGVALVVLGNYLYAIAGSDGASPLNTVERYDSKTNKWTFVTNMLTKRKHLGCAVYKDHIYAVGGRDDLSELNSVEKYDPNTNQWYPVAPMKSRRSGVGLAVVNGNLVAIGGFDGSMYLKTVEIYDSESDSWKTASSMIFRRLGGGVGVVNLQKHSVLLKSKLSSSCPMSQTVKNHRQTNSSEIQSNSHSFLMSSMPSLLANVPSSSGRDRLNPTQVNSTESHLLSDLNILSINEPVNIRALVQQQSASENLNIEFMTS